MAEMKIGQGHKRGSDEEFLAFAAKAKNWREVKDHFKYGSLRAVQTRLQALRKRGTVLLALRTNTWSTDQDKALIQAWAATKTLGEVAAKLGISEARIRARVKILRGQGAVLPDDRWSKTMVRFHKVWNEARNPAEVSAVLGLPKKSVSEMASRYRRHGMDLKLFGTRPIKGNIDGDLFCTVYNHEKDLDMTSMMLGIAVATVRQYASRFRTQGFPVKGGHK